MLGTLRLVAISLLLLTAAEPGYAGGLTLPAGWRLPTDKEANEGERKEHGIASLINGDWDGDGRVDSALLAISEDGNTEALLVVMFPSGKEKWFVLDRGGFNKILFMGLGKHGPGTYQVLCSTEQECEHDYKKPITFVHDTIVYYRPESASSIFVWNAEHESFDRIWESD